MLRTWMYGGLVFGIVAVLWAYAGQLSSSSRRLVLKPDYPIAIARAKAVANIAPWSAGDVELAIEVDLTT